jgi:hypothetical protein
VRRETKPPLIMIKLMYTHECADQNNDTSGCAPGTDMPGPVIGGEMWPVSFTDCCTATLGHFGQSLSRSVVAAKPSGVLILP